MRDQDLEQKIRTRAHEIWEQNGRVDGQAEEHWRQAECELTAMSEAKPPAELQQDGTAPKSPSKRRAASKATPAADAPKRRRTVKELAPA